IEKSVNAFIKEFKLDTNPPVQYNALYKILVDNYNYKIDHKRLNDFEELRELRGLLKPGKQSKLFLNPRLTNAQKLFIIGKELAYNYLGIKNRSEIHSSLKLNTFDHLLNNFISAYFSTALIINKDYFIIDINKLFEQERWDENIIQELIAKYDVTPEMFLQRIANLSGKVWALKKYFFLRFNSERNTDVYDLTKEVKLNIKQNPGGYQTNEHYCRRWISIEVLKDLKAKLKGNGDNYKMKIGILHSKFYDTEDEYLSISIAQENVLNKNLFTSVSLGFYIDDQFKNKIKFLNDPEIPFRIVNNTCEMCKISDCKERISEPLTLRKIQKSEKIETAIKKL
ncbi:MAG: hypothetical protein P8X47_00355, partial [Ignavibacteriaceae bacterium]